MTDEKQADAERLDLVEEYAQGVLSVLTSDELLSHIPVVKTVAAAMKAVGTVRDQILLTKIAHFLETLSGIPAADREAMVRRLEADPAYNRRVGLHLVEVLDRVDSHRKPLMLGYCFLAYAQGRIDALQLQRLTSAIERLPTSEIDSVRKFVHTRSDETERGEIHAESIQALVNAGLAAWSSSAPIGGPRALYKENRTCELFVELALDTRSKN